MKSALHGAALAVSLIALLFAVSLHFQVEAERRELRDEKALVLATASTVLKHNRRLNRQTTTMGYLVDSQKSLLKIATTLSQRPSDPTQYRTLYGAP